MRQEINLEQYYSGDKNWKNFVAIAKQNTEFPLNMKRELLEIFTDDQDIAFVVYYRMLDDSLNWIKRKIPALDHLTPLECLKSPELIKRVKEVLMRMP